MLNKVMLICALGADPELRYMQSGDPIATLRVATSRRWKDKQSGERKEETEWHRVTFFGATAKVCGEYLKKGSKVYIEGRIKTDKYQKDGVDVYRTGIVGEVLQMLDSRSGNNDQNANQNPINNENNHSAGSDFSDDIPFNSLNWQIRRHLC
jgi:single-strand DNA-binding protein